MDEKEKNDEILTVTETARRLKVHPYTVYELLKSGALVGFKLRRRWRVLESSLKTFVSKEYTHVKKEKEVKK